MFRELFGLSKPQPQTQPQPAAAPAPRPVNTVSDTVLGLSSNLKGNLKTEGNVRIDGIFKGNVTTQGNVVVGPQGKIDGNISGKLVEIAGVVNGDVIGQRVSVRGSGRVRGDLRLEKLMTEEGAFIQGLVTMLDQVDLPGVAPEVPAVEAEPVSASSVEKAAEVAKVAKTPVSKN